MQSEKTPHTSSNNKTHQDPSTKSKLQLKYYMDIEEKQPQSSSSYYPSLRINGTDIDQIMKRDPLWKISPYLAVCKPRRVPKDFKHRKIPADICKNIVNNYFYCQICQDLLTNPKTIKPCLHKCCANCISQYIRKYRKQCPFCRDEVLSKRALREDPRFDKIMKAIISNVEQYRIDQNQQQTQLVKKSIQNYKVLVQIRQDKDRKEALREIDREKQRQLRQKTRAEKNRRKQIKAEQLQQSQGRKILSRQQGLGQRIRRDEVELQGEEEDDDHDDDDDDDEEQDQDENDMDQEEDQSQLIRQDRQQHNQNYQMKAQIQKTKISIHQNPSPSPHQHHRHNKYQPQQHQTYQLKRQSKALNKQLIAATKRATKNSNVISRIQTNSQQLRVCGQYIQVNIFYIAGYLDNHTPQFNTLVDGKCPVNVLKKYISKRKCNDISLSDRMKLYVRLFDVDMADLRDNMTLNEVVQKYDQFSKFLSKQQHILTVYYSIISGPSQSYPEYLNRNQQHHHPYQQQYPYPYGAVSGDASSVGGIMGQRYNQHLPMPPPIQQQQQFARYDHRYMGGASNNSMVPIHMPF